jgi:hypothetical protein
MEMKTLCRMSFRSRVKCLINLAAVLTLVATALPTARASDLSAAAGDQVGLAELYTLADCEAVLAQTALYPRQGGDADAGLIAWHGEPQGYGICYPAAWRISIPDTATFVLTPSGQNLGVRFYVIMMDTPDTMTESDLQWHIRWFNTIIDALPDADVSQQALWQSGNLTAFEAEYTYTGTDVVFSRWVRLIYVGTHQYWLVAEAPAAIASGSLRPIFETVMLTFRPDDQMNSGT